MQPQDTLAAPGPQDVGSTHNPYATPSAQVHEPVDAGMVKAGRVQRLLAVIVDTMVIGLAAIVMAIALPAYQDYTLRAGGAPAVDNGMLNAVLGILGILVIAYLAYQCYWLWKSGQTLGKKVMKIKIVRTDGSRASLPRILVLRIVVPAIIGAIPLLGMLFSLTDALFIFAESKRCVHDHLADTIVIDA